MSKIYGNPLTTPINPEKFGGGTDAVTYTPQTLTEEQKAQARENIGAVTLEEVLDALPVYNGEVEEV